MSGWDCQVYKKATVNIKISEFIQPDHIAGYSFAYGDQLIFFRRINSPALTSKVVIKVHPDCIVEVSVPGNISDDEVLKAVKKRSRWIYRQLTEFGQQLAFVTPRKYVSGEGHYYLGRQFMLKVHEKPTGTEEVKLFRGRFEVTVKKRCSDKVESLLNAWYKDHAKRTFEMCLVSLHEKTLWAEKLPSMRLRAMKTQWGSCSPKGILTLNPHLVKAPRECIDYVILHELCHLAEHNHSERFYRLMSQVMPQWEGVKSFLDGNAYKYLG